MIINIYIYIYIYIYDYIVSFLVSIVGYNHQQVGLNLAVNPFKQNRAADARLGCGMVWVGGYLGHIIHQFLDGNGWATQQDLHVSISKHLRSCGKNIYNHIYIYIIYTHMLLVKQQWLCKIVNLSMVYLLY